MKIIKTASGKKIKMSRQEWTETGKKAGWLKKVALLREHGIVYTFEPEHEKEFHRQFLKPFEYDVYHNGEHVERETVFCMNETEFLKLIDIWRAKSGEWEYVVPEEEWIEASNDKIDKESKAGKICKQPHGPNPSGKLDSQLFEGCEDCDRDVVKKQEKKNKKKKKASTDVESKKKKKKSTEEAEKFEYNPWAVCTDSVGRDDKAKYERCVKKVKQKEKNKLKGKK